MLPRRIARLVALFAALVVVQDFSPAAIAAGDRGLTDDLRARRAGLMERLGPDTLFVAWSAPVARYSADIDYEYRQDSNLYYLTGITQPETILVLMPGNATRREILFVRPHDPVDEHWHGRRLTADEACAASGIDTVLTLDAFEPLISALLDGRGTGVVGGAEAARFLDARRSGRAHLAIALERGRLLSDPVPPPMAFAARARERYVGFDLIDAAPMITDLRVVKTAYERQVLVRSLEISSEAQLAGMRATHPGAWEYEVRAAIEAVHRGHGAPGWAYPSIVGSGPNATILHYPDASRQMREGELLLVDAACDYGYMAGDITRTYPVSGTFSPAQRELYTIVLRAQDAAAAAARPGATLRDVHQAAVASLKDGLLALGLIADTSSDQYRMWFTHGTSHYIGLDVHDVGAPDRPLAPGMAFTIEPGVYVRQEAIDALPRSAANEALIAKIEPAVRKYANMGIRVEDSFLLEENGLRRLSGSVPRTIDDIERFMRK